MRRNLELLPTRVRGRRLHRDAPDAAPGTVTVYAHTPGWAPLALSVEARDPRTALARVRASLADAQEWEAPDGVRRLVILPPESTALSVDLPEGGRA